MLLTTDEEMFGRDHYLINLCTELIKVLNGPLLNWVVSTDCKFPRGEIRGQYDIKVSHPTKKIF